MPQMDKYDIPDVLHDRNLYRDMSRWFSPRLLMRVVRNVLASTLFGQYADKRVTHASLDQVSDEVLGERCGLKADLCDARDGSLWLDYVADVGDGFDSTYAIAYFLGQRELEVDGQTLPRGNCLIMGGDQVYPDASRDDYKYRMQTPYEAAFPRTDKPGSEHPPVFFIPGNHDWYDGLTLFLAKFCRGRDTFLGSWVARQSRSYFAVRLKDDWWAWGFDSQLGEDVDIPQANYFVSIAKQMKAGSKVILCASAPTWIHADRANERQLRVPFERGLDYVSNILKNECQGAKVPLVLSGDLHHYSRFVSETSNSVFVGAGGGGAFLHPTHGLPKTVSLTWAKRLEKLAMPEKTLADKSKADVCYPSRVESRRLALGNLWFLPKNMDFCLTLGGIYWVAAMLLLAWRGYGEPGEGATFCAQFVTRLESIVPTPVFLAVVGAFAVALIRYADVSPKRNRLVGGLHALVHILIVVCATAFVSILVTPLKSLPVGDILYFAGLGIGMLVAGAVGGIVWGLYLLICSYWLGGHPNDAFSAMRLDSYRHFIRMKIDGNKVTVFPVGIDKSPSRSDWKKNEKYEQGSQSEPFFVPTKPLGQHFIEEPFTVDADTIKPLGVK